MHVNNTERYPIFLLLFSSFISILFYFCFLLFGSRFIVISKFFTQTPVKGTEFYIRRRWKNQNENQIYTKVAKITFWTNFKSILHFQTKQPSYTSQHFSCITTIETHRCYNHNNKRDTDLWMYSRMFRSSINLNKLFASM